MDKERRNKKLEEIIKVKWSRNIMWFSKIKLLGKVRWFRKL